MTLFLPKEVHFAQIPTQNYDAFQPKREDNVVEATKIWLKKYLHSTKDKEDNEDCETDDEDDAPSSKLERLTEFVEALPFCTPMIMGFHISQNKANSDWCYCPC
jgi:predicted FMN-binding regulatory protein PaiB